MENKKGILMWEEATAGIMGERFIMLPAHYRCHDKSACALTSTSGKVKILSCILSSHITLFSDYATIVGRSKYLGRDIDSGSALFIRKTFSKIAAFLQSSFIMLLTTTSSHSLRKCTRKLLYLHI